MSTLPKNLHRQPDTSPTPPPLPLPPPPRKFVELLNKKTSKLFKSNNSRTSTNSDDGKHIIECEEDALSHFRFVDTHSTFMFNVEHCYVCICTRFDFVLGQITSVSTHFCTAMLGRPERSKKVHNLTVILVV
jgi:hypothetical protein